MRGAGVRECGSEGVRQGKDGGSEYVELVSE